MEHTATTTEHNAPAGLVTLTPTAQDEVRRLLSQEERPAQVGLRLGIKGGGCSGLSYLIEFTAPREGDTVLSYEGFQVFMDKKSTIYLGGVVLDFEGGLTGHGWVWKNPMATNTCGCGSSFSL